MSKYKKVYLDKNYTNLYYINKLKTKKINIKFIEDPIDYFKSIKNSTEISNIKIAHIFDGIAYIKFLFWLKNNKLKKFMKLIVKIKSNFLKDKTNFI